MKQYINDLQKLYGVWKQFKEVIEKADDANIEEDFNQILVALPPDYIPDFLQWMVEEGKNNIVSKNIDSIMQVIIDYDQYRKIWIEKTLDLLKRMEDTNVDKAISDNMTNIIKGPYKRGNTWIIFDLINKAKEIGTSREVIEQNYSEILETVFSNNEFISNNKDILLKIERLVEKLSEQEYVRLSDIEHIGSGQYSECLKIGNLVLKFGKKRVLDELPEHKRILKPLFRRNIPNDPRREIELGNIKEDDIVAIECQNIVDTNWYVGLSDEEKQESLYSIYKDLRSSNIIWTDIKVENVGKLLKNNIVEYTVKDLNGEDVKREATLPVGELVIFDTDRIYSKDKLPQFDDDPSEKKLYQIFEERFNEEMLCK